MPLTEAGEHSLDVVENSLVSGLKAEARVEQCMQGAGGGCLLMGRMKTGSAPPRCHSWGGYAGHSMVWLVILGTAVKISYGKGVWLNSSFHGVFLVANGNPEGALDFLILKKLLSLGG